MSNKGAPQDACGSPVPAFLTLGQTLAWELWRKADVVWLQKLTEDASPEMVRTVAQSWARVEQHIRSGDLPIRGKAVRYRPVGNYISPPIRVVASEYDMVRPEDLVDARLNFLSSSVRHRDLPHVNELWADVIIPREDVLRLWSAPRSPRVQAKSNSIRLCQMWLIGEMRASPKRRPHTKDWFRNEAKRLFSRITDNAFDQIWRQALQETGAEWGRAGRPR
jgi:hypothetical protein